MLRVDVMMPMLRLIAYTDATSFGGAEASLGNLLHALRESIETTVVGTDATVVHRIASYRESAGARVVAAVRDKRDLMPILAHIRTFRELRPDVCHVNLRTPYSCQYGLLATLAAPRARIVAVEHLPLATRSPLRRWLKRGLSRRVAAHVAVGLRTARIVEEEAKLPRGSVRTIHNGVPDVPIDPLPRLASGPVVGSLGRLDPQKGYDVLIEALASLPDTTAVLVGDGPARDDLEGLARDRGVGDRVLFTGWSSEPRRYLSGFDVFVLPSRYEGFPLSIIEAMLAGLPVVATDVGSVSECVRNGEAGVLVPPDDHAALVEALARLLGDQVVRARLGARGREVASASFTDTTMARSYEQLYAEILT
jgi:glycosyltransferase involved in cell wall biosynthesis